MHFFFLYLIYGGQWTLRMFSTFLSNSTINFFSLFWAKIDKILLNGKNILVIQPEQERLRKREGIPLPKYPTTIDNL